MDEETDGALNADMMERLHIPLDAASVYGWHNVAVWVRHLGQGSYIYQAKNNEEAAYLSPLHIAAQLADIFDLLARSRYGKDADKIKYPRPWDGRRERMRFGKPEDAIPISDFDKWWNGGE